MRNLVATPSFIRGALVAALALGAIAAGAAPAVAGRPTIFELQDHLRQLPEKQRAREAARPEPMSAPLVVDEETPHQAPRRRK